MLAEIKPTDRYRQLMIYPIQDNLGSNERLIGITFVPLDPPQITFNDWVDHFQTIGLVNIKDGNVSIFISKIYELNFYENEHALLADLRQVLSVNSIEPIRYKYI